MTFTPLTRRATSRLREHTLEISREGIFRGQRAILTRCTDSDCGWTGWFTDTEMRHTGSQPTSEGRHPDRRRTPGPTALASRRPVNFRSEVPDSDVR